ncbi:uncharacterized protein B0T15DRAFT_264828 [Chaetomium strumarium]|uniref:Uncharacterized protein n=1 Tax=Chaetomium strumarium TaxID=1170767 RepID=A0AAJ0GNT8_9PEZI|nr:hypothetical protein B0T15DRAFT_264828 [Chaetomium strumarium]
MTYRPPIPHPVQLPIIIDAAETRTLLTFPTEGLPSPCIVPHTSLRAFPVRYPTGSAPAQTQINRWLCCRCAEEGYPDPVGMVHYPSPPPASSSSSSAPLHQQHHHHHDRDVPQNNNNTNEDYPADGSAEASSSSGGDDGSFDVCWRTSCRHRKCVNCALYAGPLGRDGQAKLLIRTVGGLHASPRFVDPVYWECAGCGDWASNRFDSRCTLGITACANAACPFRWRAAQAQLGAVVVRHGQLVSGGETGGGSLATGAGLLTAESVVMNRYGQRLGTADQRVAVSDGPWDWQRRALGDPRCAIVAGLRAAMRRDGGADGRAMQFGSRVNNGSHATAMCDSGALWKDGEPVPHYPYRRPPPLDGSDADENNEYEGSYLAGMPTEPLDKGKSPEQHYTSPSRNPPFYAIPSPAAASSGAVSSGSLGSLPGWSRLHM